LADYFLKLNICDIICVIFGTGYIMLEIISVYAILPELTGIYVAVPLILCN